jgi:hypothetical protein
MRIALKAFAIWMGLGVASAAYAHPRLDLPLNALISGSSSMQSAPMITFENLMNGTSGVMMMVRGMVGSEFMDALAFNFGGSGTPTFTHLAGPAAAVTFDSNNVTLGPVGKGGAGFDVLFDYPNAQADRFDGNDVVSLYTITGAGVDEGDFNVTNASGLFAMAHINAIGPNDGSAFVAAAVPEAEVYAMLLAGLGLLGFIMGRRRRSVVPAL